MKLEELQAELVALRERVDELQARDMAMLAFVHSGFFTLPTAHLRGALITLEPLAEQLVTKILFMSVSSDKAIAAFEARKQYWLEALKAEIAAREAVQRE